MISLHERLSEFSFGYGVTNEALTLLSGIGLHPVPFLPSLIHEGDLAFDVAFSAPGTILMLQFKLGEQLRRFRRRTPFQPIPELQKPFWRFSVNTGEQQFLRLLSYQVSGADVYYVAPRFSDWATYATLFLNQNLLDNSLIMPPMDIHDASGSAGAHRIVYDAAHRYVCSEPVEAPEIRQADLIEKVSSRARPGEPSLGDAIEQLWENIEKAATPERKRLEYDLGVSAIPIQFKAMIVALDAWLQGAQTIFVGTRPATH